VTLHAADAAEVALERGTDSDRGLPGEEAGRGSAATGRTSCGAVRRDDRADLGSGPLPREVAIRDESFGVMDADAYTSFRV
jgi:hypothetical protein